MCVLKKQMRMDQDTEETYLWRYQDTPARDGILSHLIPTVEVMTSKEVVLPVS